eukprot:g18942.t1
MYSSAPRRVDPVPRWQRPRPTGDSEDLEVGGARAVTMQHGYRSSRAEAAWQMVADGGRKANLLQYFRAISSNRALIVKVFLILIFFVIFFVVFLA